MNTINKWPLLTRLLHWLSALLIFGLFDVGLYMTSLTYYDPLYHQLPWWHKSFGIVLIALIGMRLVRRAMVASPASEPGHSAFERVAAKITHLLLYVVTLLIGVSGYLISTAKGKGIEVFGWFEIPALITPFEDQADIAGAIHLYLAWALMALVALHAAGAIKHHLIDKDNTLKRMI